MEDVKFTDKFTDKIDIPRSELAVNSSPFLGKLLVYRNPLKSWITGGIPLFFAITYFAKFDSIITVIGLMLFGALYWTLLEYIIHRWLYHVNYKNYNFRRFIESFHMHHHRHITDGEVLNAGPLLIYPKT